MYHHWLLLIGCCFLLYGAWMFYKARNPKGAQSVSQQVSAVGDQITHQLLGSSTTTLCNKPDVEQGFHALLTLKSVLLSLGTPAEDVQKYLDPIAPLLTHEPPKAKT